jgi:hypothetical protein
MQELVPMREALAEELRQLARELMRRELELMEVHEVPEFAAAVRRIAEHLSAVAASWARLSDSIRGSWHI